MTVTVLPLIAVVTLRAAPALVALLVGIPMGTAMLGRLAAAPHAERVQGATWPLVAIEVSRVVLLAAIPLLWLASSLSMLTLMVLAGLIGALAGAFGAYGAPLIISLVSDEEIVKANGALQTSENVASVIGPGIASLLLELIAPPLVVFIEVASYIITLPSLRLLGRRLKAVREEPAVAESAEPTSNATGNRNAFLAPFLSRKTNRLLAATLLVTLLNGIILAELAPFMVRHLHIASSVVALVGAVGAIGGIGAGIYVGRFANAVGEQRGVDIGLIIIALATVFFPLARQGLIGLWPCLAYELLGSAGGTLLIVLVFTIVQRDLPRAQLARGMAAAALVPEIGQLLGTAVASLVTSMVSVSALFDGAAAIGAVVVVFGFVRLLRGLASQPRQGSPQQTPQATAVD